MAPGSPQSGVGRIIDGRYVLLDRLGSGGMGHVWLAHDQRLDCDVALKEIRFRNPADGAQELESRIARARAEARHAAVLRGHPHVVTVHDVLEYEGLPWIVMEYVPGAEDLRALLARRGPLAPDECARIGIAVLDALTAGHERGIMHRDVKPANILLAPGRTGTPGSRILLTDYGISVQPDSPETRWTRTSALVGSPGYLAPERATGGPATAAADLFSLGCTLYFGVEGCGPFDRDTDLATITAVVLEEPRPPLRAGALRPLIESLLVKDLGLRLSAEDTAAALARIITPEPHPPSHLDTGSQPPWPGPTPSAGGAPPPGQEVPYPAAYTPTAEGSGGPAPYTPPAQGTGAPTPRTPAHEGFGPPSPYSPPSPYAPQPGRGSGPPWYGAPPGAPWQPSGRRRRRRSRLLQAAVAVLLALGLAGGGFWYAMAHKVVQPYGPQVGLADPLKLKDCVVATRSGGRVTEASRLEVDPSCGRRSPDGQVMALYKASSAKAARAEGRGKCQARTDTAAKKLDRLVESVPVIPTDAGFEAAGGTVACLLVGIHGPVFGPLDTFRPYGMAFDDAAQMQTGDCLDGDGDARSRTHYSLVSCDQEHKERVVAHTYLDSFASDGKADAAADRQCESNAPAWKFDGGTGRLRSHGVISTGLWSQGYYLVVCTVESATDGMLPGGR